MEVISEGLIQTASGVRETFAKEGMTKHTYECEKCKFIGKFEETEGMGLMDSYYYITCPKCGGHEETGRVFPELEVQ